MTNQFDLTHRFIVRFDLFRQYNEFVMLNHDRTVYFAAHPNTLKECLDIDVPVHLSNSIVPHVLIAGMQCISSIFIAPDSVAVGGDQLLHKLVPTESAVAAWASNYSLDVPIEFGDDMLDDEDD